MTEPIERIPPEAGWRIATKGLTGALTATDKALKEAIGQEKYNEFNGQLWYRAGKAVKELIDAFEIPVGDAREIEEALELVVRASMGPEFEFEVVEATRERCVVRTLKCAWYERYKEQGIDWDFCSVGHERWGNGAVESVNPDFTFRLPNTMPRGEPYCEIIIERKR